MHMIILNVKLTFQTVFLSVHSFVSDISCVILKFIYMEKTITEWVKAAIYHHRQMNQDKKIHAAFLFKLLCGR